MEHWDIEMVVDGVPRSKNSWVKDDSMINNVIEQKEDQAIFNCRVKLKIIFYLPIANSKDKRLRGKGVTVYSRSTPDLDNMAKHVIDLMKRKLFSDDTHVSSLFCEKYHDENPRTEISIKYLY